MKKPKPPTLPPVNFNVGGVSYRVVPPRSVEDVDCQPDVPSWILALLAFAPLVNGRLFVSKFTCSALRDLNEQCGAPLLREMLRQLVLDISGGYRPANPYGLFISRCRRMLTDCETIDAKGGC